MEKFNRLRKFTKGEKTLLENVGTLDVGSSCAGNGSRMVSKEITERGLLFYWSNGHYNGQVGSLLVAFANAFGSEGHGF